MERLVAPSRTHPAHGELQARIQEALRSLPSVGEADVTAGEICAICLMSFESIFEAEAEMLKNGEVERNSIRSDDENIIFGVTKVAFCGHLFCRQDLTEWIKGFHGNCPTCRHPFLDIKPPSDSDDESSDGGEYVPNLEDEEDLETVDYTDGFSDGLEYEADLQLMEEMGREQEAQILMDQAAAEEEEMERIRAEQVEAEALPDEQYSEQQELEEQDLLRLQFLAEGDWDEQLFAEEDEMERARQEQEEMEALSDEYRAWEEHEALQQELASEGIWDDGDDMDIQEEYDALEQEYAAEALMDVYLTDSSSDLDYEPQDYMMSDSDSDAASSDFDFSVEELENLDHLHDPVTIRYGSSNESLLGLQEARKKASPSSVDPENSNFERAR